MTEKIHNDYFKWWCGTVIVGAIPIFIRLIAYTLTNKSIELFNITELVCFGFSIQISSIYFGMGKPSKLTENRLILNTTLSVVFVMLFSIIYIMSIMSPETLESSTTKIFWLSRAAFLYMLDKIQSNVLLSITQYWRRNERWTSNLFL